MKRILLIVSLLLLMTAGSLYATEPGKVDIHGFISQGYLKSDENNYLGNSSEGSFEFNELGINFGTRLSPKLRMGMQLFARDLGALGNDEVVVDWAYADYRFQQWLGVRVGKTKVPIGLYNETRDMDMLRPSILLPALYLEDYRESISSMKGTCLYGDIPIKDMVNIEYYAQVGVWDIESEGGIASAFEMNDTFYVTGFDMHTSYSTGVQLEFPFGLKLKGTIYSTSFDMATETTDNPFWRNKEVSPGVYMNVPPGFPILQELDITQYVYSIQYTWNNLVLAAEYSALEQNYEMMGVKGDRVSEPYYFSMSYRFTDWFELGSYYSVFYPFKDDKHGKHALENGSVQPIDVGNDGVVDALPDYNHWSKDIALSFRFDVNESWIIKLEGHKINGSYGCHPKENLPTADNPNGTEEDWHLFAAKVSYNF